jgi:ABC-2 type transport system ATP-binding protein
MLQVSNLKKRFGAIQAVNGVTFSVSAGETLGLLGPNGAGKTTTVSLIAGLLTADSGTVLIDGQALRGDSDPTKRRLGLVPQDLGLYDELTALDNLRLFGALYTLSGAPLTRAIGEAMALVGLSDRLKDKVKGYSGGMKRRLNLAAALLHDPQILILDEPTVGVDPQSRNAIFDNLEALKKRGKTLVYTTHYMEEAERLCDRLVIVDHGDVVANDTLRGLYRRLDSESKLRIELEAEAAAPDLSALAQLSTVSGATFDKGILLVSLRQLEEGAPAVLRWLSERGHRYHHVVTERPNLESVFLSLTGRSLRDA